MGTQQFTPLTLDTNGAAALIGVTPDLLKKWRVAGLGPPFLKLGSGQPGSPATVRYRIAAIEEWLAECERKSTSDPGPRRAAG